MGPYITTTRSSLPTHEQQQLCFGVCSTLKTYVLNYDRRVGDEQTFLFSLRNLAYRSGNPFCFGLQHKVELLMPSAISRSRSTLWVRLVIYSSLTNWLFLFHILSVTLFGYVALSRPHEADLLSKENSQDPEF